MGGYCYQTMILMLNYYDFISYQPARISIISIILIFKKYYEIKFFRSE